ncbi:MAG: hypothetical protein RJB66_2331 [Pseudomonadota bacterium]
MNHRSFFSKINLVHSLLLLALVAWTCLHAPSLGRDDLGFRVEKIDLNLSQKFPPSMALEILDEEGVVIEQSNADTVIELKVGPPELELLQLEELSFGFLEQVEPQSPIITANSGPQEFSEGPNIFNDEEKLRLKLAKERRGLQIEDIHPATENQALGDRLREVLAENKQPEQAPLQRQEGLAIEGEIEFVRDGSLALTDKHFIDVRRFEEGVAKEVAAIDLNRGTFSMKVNSTRGVVVGRLTNQRGGVEGEGLISVSDLLLAKGAKLVLKRTAQKLPVRVSSAYGKSEQLKATLGLATSWGFGSALESDYEVNEFDPQSQLVVEGQSQNHRNSVALVDIGAGSDVMLLPERMIWGLREILNESDISLDLDRGDSLIYGVIQASGRPVEGATVISSLGPTSYFGGFYLPDRTQQQTSENGMFTIVGSQHGWQDLYIGLPNGKGYHQNVLLFPGKVTNIIAETPTEAASITVRSFDAFSGQSRPAKIEVQQLNDIFELDPTGALVLEIPKTKGISFINVLPEAGYEPMHLSYHHLLDYLHLPLIPREWLEEMRASLKINEELDTGSIVGFVQGEDFFVEIPNKNSKSKTVYFDPTGKPVERGVNGGGFVIFNLEQDSPNLIVYSRRNRRALGRIVKPQRDSVQVVQASFE